MVDNFILASNKCFQVTIDGITDENERFYAVRGLFIGYQTQTYTPGGESTSVAITTQVTTQPLVLKRPLANVKSGFSQWCIDTLETGTFTPVTMNVFVLNNDGSINNHWVAEQIYPISLEVSPMDIEEQHNILFEIITIMYVNLRRLK